MHGHRPGQTQCLTPSKKVGLVLEKKEQAEASTLLHESSNSEPETIKQGEIVFHYIRVRVAGVGVIPLVGTKPVVINRKNTNTCSVASTTVCHVKESIWGKIKTKHGLAC